MQDFSNNAAAHDLESKFSPIIDESYQKYDGGLRRISLEIHKFQELAFQERQSSNVLSGFLEQEGFTVQRGIAGNETAFVATFSQGKGSVVSFNAVRLSEWVSANARNMMHSPGWDMLVDII